MRWGECSEFIENSSSPGIVVDMSEERGTPTAKQQKKPRRWRPTERQVLRVIGLGFALVASIFIAFVVAIGMGNRFGYVPLGMVLLFILVRIGYRYEWTGFAETARPKSEKSEIQ